MIQRCSNKYNCYVCNTCGGKFMDPIDGLSPCCKDNYTEHFYSVFDEETYVPKINNGQKSISPSSRKDKNSFVNDSDDYYIFVSAYNKGYYSGRGKNNRVMFESDLDDSYLFTLGGAMGFYKSVSDYVRNILLMHRVEVKNNKIVRDLGR